jgi:hypothetical protein
MTGRSSVRKARPTPEPEKISTELYSLPPLKNAIYCSSYREEESCSTVYYVRALISLWLFLFPVCSTTKRIFLGWVQEVRTTKS